MHEPGRKPVVDLALSSGNTAVSDAASRSKILGRLRLSDAVFRNLTRGAAIFAGTQRFEFLPTQVTGV